MGLAPILLVGPVVAAIGLFAVIFVMRHKSVQTKSMYSARRGQIERKVRAARQRTLAPTSKHADAAAPQTFPAPGMEAKEAIPTATWGPAFAPPSAPPPLPPAPQVWEVGPTAPPSAPPSEPPPPFEPPSGTPPPPFAPPSEAPPSFEPQTITPSAPAYEPVFAPPAEEVWNPAPGEPFAPAMAEPAGATQTPAGEGASWSIVGENKAGVAEPPVEKKAKKDKQAHSGSSWQLASGLAPGEDAEDELRRPGAAMAIAQYAVLVVGLVMVLIGVMVMVANTHTT
ncbi:MAG TPA: hypothetical protein VLR46_02050 [Candidatus Dormibacteraeota bacterium]|nr:hypothetical protein [Candidatus Dormibacteraeota bacterium]